ncbi:MAG: DUF2254 domain-containing protein [Litorimonas sp.]
MNAWIIQSLLRLRASYYFIPSLMCFAAIGLGLLTVAIDLNYQPEIREALGWFYASTVDNARSILTTVAGSMISVAAVTFSLTMVAVTTAAGQYGPRLIGNFMRDRSNQVTLGMFLSTFLFCIVVLRSVSDEMGDGAAGLIPSVSVLVALILTLISVGVLIYFIHHIPETLNVGTLTSKVAQTLLSQIERGQFPNDNKLETVDGAELGDPFDPALTQTVRSRASGYVEAISLKGLLEWTDEQGCRVRLRRVPGDFVMQGDALMDIAPDNPAQPLAQDLNEQIGSDVRGFVALGRERTVYQNLLFPADELVEIASRALSPGVNDPFTAINCIHWFGDICLAMINAPKTPDCVIGADGTPRIWAGSVGFDRLCDTLFGQSRQYICADENVSRQTLDVLYHVRDRADAASAVVLDDQIALLHEAIEQSGLGKAQKARLRGGPPYKY